MRVRQARFSMVGEPFILVLLAAFSFCLQRQQPLNRSRRPLNILRGNKLRTLVEFSGYRVPSVASKNKQAGHC